MRNRPLLLLIGFLVIVVGVLHAKLKPRPTQAELQQAGIGAGSRWRGKLAPDFEVQTTEGDQFKLSEHVGKQMVIINFFATWCGPCREEMPELNRYVGLHKNDPVLLLAIDAREQPDQVANFARELKLDFPVAIDHGSLLGLFGVAVYPTTILIGVDGKVELYQVGALMNADVAFDTFLRANRGLLASGNAISTYAYLKASGRFVPATPAKPVPAPLDARALRIAARMDCPCGCDKKVAGCECHTAHNIKKALGAGGFGRQSDVAIVKALNKKYCMGGM